MLKASESANGQVGAGRSSWLNSQFLSLNVTEVLKTTE